MIMCILARIRKEVPYCELLYFLEGAPSKHMDIVHNGETMKKTRLLYHQSTPLPLSSPDRARLSLKAIFTISTSPRPAHLRRSYPPQPCSPALPNQDDFSALVSLVMCSQLFTGPPTPAYQDTHAMIIAFSSPSFHQGQLSLIFHTPT